MSATFAETVAAALAGDAAAYSQLYRSYAGRIRAFAEARGTDDSEAVANDVMLRAFRNLPSFRGDERAFVRWIFAIARNRLIDLHRSSQRRPEIVPDVEPPERSVPPAEMLAIDRLEREAVLEMLEVLTDEQREVIALRMVEDLSLAEVAAIVEKPISAVKALQRRGLRRLEREIFDKGVS